MAQLVGKNGFVDIGGSTIAGIREWKIDKTYDVIDVTAFSDAGTLAAKDKMTGLYQWSGSFSGNHTDAVSYALTGASVTLKLYINNTEYYTGSAYITGSHPAVTVDGEAVTAYDFTGTGALDESNIS